MLLEGLSQQCTYRVDKIACLCSCGQCDMNRSEDKIKESTQTITFKHNGICRGSVVFLAGQQTTIDWAFLFGENLLAAFDLP